MYVHEITSPWNPQTVTWNSQPEINPVVVDYSEFRYGHIIDITSLIKKWYQAGSHNGIMLKTAESGIINLYSSDHISEAYRPYISITYANFSGIEDYLSYTSMNIGRSGTAYINNYNGNLVFTHSDIIFSGNRLPLQISHVYNSNNISDNIGFGNGWRLNLSQTITTKSIGKYDYYVYTDGDGSVHYFIKRINADPLLETPGINLKLTIDDNNYIIKDGKDNTLLFNQEGYLTEVKDNQGNITTVEYCNNQITSVKDGSGRVANLTYDSAGNLSMITDPSQRQILFQYFDNNLTLITYPDSLTTAFEYNSDLLQVVKHPDNQQLGTQYYTDNSVQSITNISAEGNLGQSYSFDYEVNATKITDANGKTVSYQFNNYGNALNIIDPELNAASYHYENNLVMHAVPFQNTTINLLKNHDMAEVRDWELINDNSSASGGNYWDGGYFGHSSLQIAKADTSGRSYFSQGLEAVAGTYTLSGYIKTSELSGEGLGAALLIKYEDGSGNWVEIVSPGVTGTQDWQRMHVTFTIPEGNENNQIIVGLMVQGTIGSAWFDCIQLETGIIPTNYNILENSSFESGYWNPDNWSSTESLFGNYSLLVYGDEGYENSYKSVENRCFRGTKGDKFVVSGWAKANSVPKGSFQIVVRFSDLQGRSVDYFVPFNKSTTDWQYTSAVIEAPYGYRYSIGVDYRWNSNMAYFDGIQMTKVGTESYKYDSSYNLTSIMNANNQLTTFAYSPSNDLTKIFM